MCDRNQPGTVIHTETKDGVTTELRRMYGHAGKKNRGRGTSATIHAIRAYYIVNVDESAVVRPGTYAAEWRRTRQPVLCGASPSCNCTTGQHSAQPFVGLTADKVSCKWCVGIVERAAAADAKAAAMKNG